MAGKKPEGGGFGRGSSGNPSGGGGRKKLPKPKPKPKVTKEDAMKKHPAGKGLPNQGAKAKVYDIKTKGEVKNPKPVKPAKPAQKPLNLTTRGKVVATVGTGVAAVGTTKGMKKAGEMNAARIRRNKAKSVPVPRNPRKQ
jgi:hypothetical protein